MPLRNFMQKLYCYVDETGQDMATEFFVVVSVVNDKDQNLLRIKLRQIEAIAKIGQRKWHKADIEKRKQFLKLVIKDGIGNGEIYYGRYPKPLPYFLPMLDVLEKAIRDKAEEKYRAIVYVDGIDKKKAAELTNALRVRGVKLEFVRSARDESEPLIRLADRWAGCIRASFLNKSEEKEIFQKAQEKRYLRSI